MKSLTTRQQQVYDFIVQMVVEKGFPPTRTEIQEFLGVKSPNSAELYVKILAKKGFIRITPGISRGMTLTRNDWMPMMERLEVYWSLMRGDLESWEPSEALKFIEALHELQKKWITEKLGL